LITADDVRHGKPDPEGYLAAAQRLGVTPNDCIVVEDAPAGIAAARAAGMRCVAVAGTFPPSRLVDADVVLPELSRLTVTVSAGRPRLHLRI
jgi:sugar-phosphatase